MFVLNPRGKIVVSVYSSGAIGRLVPGDVAGLVRCAREHAAAPAKTATEPLAGGEKPPSVPDMSLFSRTDGGVSLASPGDTRDK